MTYLAANSKKLTPRRYRWLISALMAIVVMYAVAFTPAANFIEQNTSLSWLFQWRGPLPAPQNIVIVNLNSTTAEHLGLSRHSYNWPRSLYAQLLDKLTGSSAKLVIFDISFKSPREEVEDLPFETAIANNGRVLLHTYMQRHQITLANGIADIEQPVPPLPRFAQFALGTGYFTLPKTAHNIKHATLMTNFADGVQISQPLLGLLELTPIEHQKNFWQLMSAVPFDERLSLTARAQKFYQLATNARLKPSGFSDAKMKQLFDIFSHTAPMAINYYGAAQSFLNIDIDKALALNDHELKAFFESKVVYVGYLETRQTEQQDAYQTVFTSDTGLDISGVEISATVLANLVGDEYIRLVSTGLLWFLILAALLLGFALCSLQTTYSLLSQCLLVSLYLGIAYFSFTLLYFALPITLPLSALILGNLVQWHRLTSNNQIRLDNIRFALSQYLPEEAANNISQNLNHLEKQHALVHGVVLMTDIKGYTSLSEILPANQLHQLMNAYYKELIAVVQKHGGTIGNIVGDSLMAIWTGPELTNSMCIQAMHAVRDIQSAIKGDPQFSQHLPTCAALHGGQFSLGNLGGTGHYEYSPVGDIINTVSRIEHFNRDLGTAFLCSDVIAKHLLSQPSKSTLLKLGRFELRNKVDQLTLYTEIGPTNERTQKEYKDTQNFLFAIDKFEQGDHSAAIAILEMIESPALRSVCDFYVLKYKHRKAK